MSDQTTTKLNIELLTKIKEQILREPERFDMSCFFDEEDDPFPPFTDDGSYCGTSACIGGWAIFLSDKKLNSPGEHMDDKAQALLGFPKRELTSLFYANCWPEDLRDEYYSLHRERDKLSLSKRSEHSRGDARSRSVVAARVIDRVISGEWSGE